MEGNMTEEKFESKWPNMPGPSHHAGEADPGREKDIGEGHLRAEAEAAPGAPRDPGDTVEAKAAPRDPNLVLKVVQGSEVKRKGNTAGAKVAQDQNQEKKNPEKAGLNQDRSLRKKTTPELRVGPSREKTVDPSPSQNPDRENSEVYSGHDCVKIDLNHLRNVNFIFQ